MSHLWVKDADRDWKELPIDSALVQVAPSGLVPLVVPELLNGVCDPVLLRTEDSCGSERWALLVSSCSRVRVNGETLLTSVHILRDRDAIALDDGSKVFFSTERIAQIEPFPGDDRGTCCIRCKLPLEPGTPAVRCPAPGCGFWHHQSDEQPCWSYRPSCAGCGHPTAFDAGFQWSPSEL